MNRYREAEPSPEPDESEDSTEDSWRTVVLPSETLTDDSDRALVVEVSHDDTVLPPAAVIVAATAMVTILALVRIGAPSGTASRRDQVSHAGRDPDVIGA
ncbi:hypothetical protein [Xylanimonas protaetiae]|uniref:Uncharacterized protein n=1 Tax=Xylanimonas protaetiae TaxID=2509457 RepID=A0A4P6F9C7_9MICO|nr:hypothetical protein [Xylanimonas protaetiae]QAY71523.1 hypothetical protein ET471_17035 [Xylanimonas protaetiae]